MTQFSEELTFAREICRTAGQIIVRYFNEGVAAATKPDGTPVTKADKESEKLIRGAIAKRYPLDGILGEEEDELKGRTGRRWIVDPIDGTYGFSRGIPVFSTLLALEEDGDIRLGVIYNPAIDEMYWAERGGGAFKNGSRLKMSDVSDLNKAQFNFGCLSRILAHDCRHGFERIVQATFHQRGLGDYLSFARVFEGKAEGTIEVGVKPWDLAPMKILALESGGIYDDLSGGASIYTGSCLVSNKSLYDQFRKLLHQDKVAERSK